MNQTPSALVSGEDDMTGTARRSILYIHCNLCFDGDVDQDEGADHIDVDVDQDEGVQSLSSTEPDLLYFLSCKQSNCAAYFLVTTISATFHFIYIS